ncbi:MAG: hypothetical protein ABIQ13_11700 [Pedococcus sp.]
MPRIRTLPALAPVALTIAGALLLGGCGSATDSGPVSSTAAPSASSNTTSSADTTSRADTTSGTDAAFPITIERNGGLAGFADKVVVAQDGSARVTTKSGASTCSLGPETMAALARTAGAATGSPTAPAQHPDALVVTLTTSRGSVALQEGDLPGTAPEVGALLEDLAKPAAERTTCR